MLRAQGWWAVCGLTLGESDRGLLHVAVQQAHALAVLRAAEVPITEETPAGGGITNAYGRTKYMIEEILKGKNLLIE